MYPKRRWRTYCASQSTSAAGSTSTRRLRSATGASGGSACVERIPTRGPPKKPRACALPIAKKPRLSPRLSLNALPHDVIPHIVDFLPLEDIQTVRLLGLGSASPELHAHLSAVMRAHVRELQHIWAKMDANDMVDMFDGVVPGFDLRDIGRVLKALQSRRNVYAAPAEVAPSPAAPPQPAPALAPGSPPAPGSPTSACSSSLQAPPPHRRSWPLPPVAFAKLDFLSTRGMDGRMLRALLRNMPRLRRLHVSRKLRGMSPPRAAAQSGRMLRTVPAELGRCGQLTEFAMMNHRIDAVPEAILRLRSLRKLVIDQNERVTELPLDIGVRLPRLRSFSAEWCALYTVPQSLLHTLERNYVDGDERTQDYGLFVTGIPKDYLRALIPRDVFPHLHAQVSKRQKW